MRKRKVIIDEWQGAYPSSWKGVIVSDAMSHPAKYSSKLIRRIYEHMLDEKWVALGDSVLDPFGGVALGALDAMRLGLHWTGNELEEKFWKLGNQNIDQWNTQYRSMPNWGSARLLHGDSRYLLSVIGDHVQVSVSSPPYADSDQDYKGGWKRFHDGHTPLHTNDIQREAQYGTTDGQLSAMPAQQFDAAISSPPFLQSEGGTPEPKAGGTIDHALYARHAAGNAKANGYGTSEGQLSSMRDGGFAGAVSSPPYAESLTGNKSKDSEKGMEMRAKTKGRVVWGSNANGSRSADGYGETAGNLGNMPANSFNAALSSPPYAEARIGQESGQEHCGHGDQYGGTDGQLGSMSAEGFDVAVSSPPFQNVEGTQDDNFRYNGKKLGTTEKHYGNTDGQLGNDSGDDFWLAARAIVEQVYMALAPNGHAVWVVKDYVKNKQIVPFSAQWKTLCEAVGFVTLHEHHAMLVHHKGTQHLLEGGTVEKKTESKSFFRRLAEKKGSPRIDWETVFCMEKPQ
jgi:hypothetical protein